MVRQKEQKGRGDLTFAAAHINSCRYFVWFYFFINGIIPFSLFDTELVKNNLKSVPIHRNTFMKHLRKLGKPVKNNLKSALMHLNTFMKHLRKLGKLVKKIHNVAFSENGLGI